MLNEFNKKDESEDIIENINKLISELNISTDDDDLTIICNDLVEISTCLKALIESESKFIKSLSKIFKLQADMCINMLTSSDEDHFILIEKIKQVKLTL